MAENSVSYSQFSMFMSCKIRWYNDYALNKRVFEQSIHTIFGTAMHEVLQNYLTVMYSTTAKKADEIDLASDLQSRLVSLYGEAAKKTGHFSTPEELESFYQDGVEILKYFKSKRRQHFSSHHELLGIETELKVDLVNNLRFKGFVDVIIRDKRDGRINIIDLKTATRGWNKYQKKDHKKTAQLVLYKTFYAKQFGVDEDMIDVEYIILRRKINEDSEWPMKRIQTFSPANGKPTRNKIGKLLQEFIDEAFHEDGTYNMDLNIDIPKCKDKWCKYCRAKK
jgi:RecB family exonuclease